MRSALAIEPPEAFDPDWAADGLIEKPPSRTGDKAWWLRQIVAAVPLHRWSEILKCDPSQWLALPVISDWREPLVLGWIDAALAVPSLACADDFFPWLAALDPWPGAAPPRREVLAELFAHLPPDGQSKALDALIAVLPPLEVLGLMVAISENPPPALGNNTRQALRRALSAKPSTLTRPEARALALCVPLAEIQRELEFLAKLPDLTAAAEEFANTLEFRHNLLSPL